jgi:hypothetical protein
MEPVEILTLTPLAALIVVFGVQPGLLLDLVAVPVADTLAAAEAGQAIPFGPEVVLVLVGALVLGIVARIGWVLARGPGQPVSHAPATEGGAAH